MVLAAQGEKIGFRRRKRLAANSAIRSSIGRRWLSARQASMDVDLKTLSMTRVSDLCVLLRIARVRVLSIAGHHREQPYSNIGSMDDK